MDATIVPKVQKHYPVLLKEIISIISPQYGGTFIDCTFGQGGYSKKILEFSKKNVKSFEQASHQSGVQPGDSGAVGDRDAEACSQSPVRAHAGSGLRDMRSRETASGKWRGRWDGVRTCAGGTGTPPAPAARGGAQGVLPHHPCARSGPSFQRDPAYNAE